MTGACLAPVVTERLILRPLRADDEKAVVRLLGDREVTDTTLRLPHPYRPEDFRRFLGIATEMNERRTGVQLGITLRTEGRIVGAIGLRPAEDTPAMELGYWIALAEWGRGYATEAARAMVDLAFREFPISRVFAIHFGRNPASGRVLAKAGMRFEGLLRQSQRKGDALEDQAFYSILRPEWEARGAGS